MAKPEEPEDISEVREQPDRTAAEASGEPLGGREALVKDQRGEMLSRRERARSAQALSFTSRLLGRPEISSAAAGGPLVAGAPADAASGGSDAAVLAGDGFIQYAAPRIEATPSPHGLPRRGRRRLPRDRAVGRHLRKRTLGTPQA